MDKGDIIGGRFEIVEHIGNGRTSIVYRAVDLETGFEVAVKAIRHEYLVSNPDITMRFMREGATLKQLDHPYIVDVLATVEHADDSCIIMEYLGGGTVEGLLTTKGMLPIKFSLTTILKIADALAYLHGHKIIHRDITPMNIMLTEKGDPRLMDFSVSRMGHMSPMTLKSALLGTLSYMSPEMIFKREAANPKTDIWALGVTLYKMLTCELPYDLSNSRNVLNMMNMPAPLASLHRNTIPQSVDLLLQHMLEADPEKRIDSMKQVKSEIVSILSPISTEDI